MPRNGFVTSRISPEGYVCVTLPLAKELYQAGSVIILCGNNVACQDERMFRLFGWQVHHLKANLHTLDSISTAYLERRGKVVGRYVVFYVKKDELDAFISERMTS